MRTYKQDCGYGIRHVRYRMTCAEFLDLIGRADGRCEICRQERGVADLQIDHDHDVGAGAVRGLLCGPCNVRLMSVENGWKPITPAEERYLDTPWHLTGSGWLERRERHGRKARSER